MFPSGSRRYTDARLPPTVAKTSAWLGCTRFIATQYRCWPWSSRTQDDTRNRPVPLPPRRAAASSGSFARRFRPRFGPIATRVGRSRHRERGGGPARTNDEGSCSSGRNYLGSPNRRVRLPQDDHGHRSRPCASTRRGSRPSTRRAMRRCVPPSPLPSTFPSPLSRALTSPPRPRPRVSRVAGGAPSRAGRLRRAATEAGPPRLARASLATSDSAKRRPDPRRALRLRRRPRPGTRAPRPNLDPPKSPVHQPSCPAPHHPASLVPHPTRAHSPHTPHTPHILPNRRPPSAATTKRSPRSPPSRRSRRRQRARRRRRDLARRRPARAPVVLRRRDSSAPTGPSARDPRGERCWREARHSDTFTHGRVGGDAREAGRSVAADGTRRRGVGRVRTAAAAESLAGARGTARRRRRATVRGEM